MKTNNILIVEDDPALATVLRILFTQNTFNVLLADSVRAAEQQLNKQTIDIILLDWMLPDQSGADYAKILKSRMTTRDIGIIMLTAKSDEQSKITGLDSGADDYVTKPFSNSELLARVRSVLRRSSTIQTTNSIQYKNFFIDPETHLLQIDDTKVDIGIKEFQLLSVFLNKPDRVYSRSQLLDLVWGVNSFIDDRTVDVYIRRLRVTLESHGYPNLIKTIRGVGYRLSYTDKPNV